MHEEERVEEGCAIHDVHSKSQWTVKRTQKIISKKTIMVEKTARFVNDQGKRLKK